MAREYSRTSRFSEVVMRELALMLQREISDPRVGMVTVSHVDVTADLKYAKVYVTRFNGFESEQDAEECIKGLNSASGYLRRGLAGRVSYVTFLSCCLFMTKHWKTASRWMN